MSGIVGKNLGRGSGIVTATPVGADTVSGASIVDDTIDSEHYAAGSIDLEHMASESVDEDNLHISNSGSNGNLLSKQSGDAGGLTWAAVTTDLSGDSSPQLGGFLDANGNYIQMQKGGDISSASPLVIDTDGDYFVVTGTTNFAAMTVAADRHFFLEFAAILTITHGGGTIDIPGAANYTSVAGDVIECVSTASNVVTIVGMELVSGKAQVESVTLANSVTLTNKTLTAPAVTNLTGTFNSPTGTIGAVTLGGAVTGGDSEVAAVTFKDVAVKTVVLGASGGGTLTANLSLGQHFTATIDTGSSVISVSNAVASDEYMSWVISLTNGGSQTITWTAVDWEGGSAPSLTSSGLDLLGFYTYDGATTIHGFPISIASA
jgi:hypothetical protein